VELIHLEILKFARILGCDIEGQGLYVLKLSDNILA